MMKRTTIVILALAALPALAAAQQDTSRSQTAGGEVETRGRRARANAYGRGNLGLDRDQVTQLQQALRDAGCDPGAIDGVLGPRTRRAMACARQQNNLSGNNANDLLRSLNLDFTASDSMGMGGTMRSGANRGGRDQTRDNQTNQGRIRPPADSTRADSATANPRSPTAAQQGQGMHDSTTARSNPQRPPL